MLETTQRKILTTDQNPDGALFLNAAFLHFGDVVVHVDVLSRPENLSELRRKHRATHVFRATRDLVFAVPIIEGAPRLSGEQTKISLRDDPEMACHLWREALLRRFFERKREIIRGVPVQVLSRAAGDALGAGKDWESKSTRPSVLSDLPGDFRTS